MKLDLEQLKKDLSEDRFMVVDPGYIEPEIKLIYDFYREEWDKGGNCPDPLKKWMDSTNEFDFVPFLKDYLEFTLENEFILDIYYIEDGWLSINKFDKEES